MGERKLIIKKLKEFKKKVNKDLHIKKMFLFGSRARGDTPKWSDIDLVIVSDKFKNLKFRKRATKMYDYWDLEYPVDFLCYTPEEFNKLKKQITIIKEAVKEGIEIK